LGAIALEPLPGQPGKRGFELMIECYERGLMTRMAMDTFEFSPPLICERTHIDQIFDTVGAVLRDGSDPMFEWGEEKGARDPGLVPYRDMPQIERDDYVFNANDPFTFPHAEAWLDPEDAGGSDALPVYQMGNHAGAHSWMYRHALALPGVVVLHDTSLLDFYAGLYTSVGTPEFQREVDYAHGTIRGKRDDPARVDGWPAVDVDGVPVIDRATLTMERRIAEHSEGVVVHDPFAAHWLRVRYPNVPVFHIPHGAPIRGDDTRDDVRARYGWSSDDVIFGVFGGLGRIKRNLVAILSFAQVRRRWPQARMVIAGHADDSDVVHDLCRALRELDLLDPGVLGQFRLGQPAHLAPVLDVLRDGHAMLLVQFPTVFFPAPP
jgi:glycosyltransferase involved in cell wall biosynthesis